MYIVFLKILHNLVFTINYHEMRNKYNFNKFSQSFTIIFHLSLILYLRIMFSFYFWAKKKERYNILWFNILIHNIIYDISIYINYKYI